MVSSNVSSVPDIEINKRKDFKNNPTPAPERRGLSSLLSEWLCWVEMAVERCGGRWGQPLLFPPQGQDQGLCPAAGNAGRNQEQLQRLVAGGEWWKGPAVSQFVPEESEAKKTWPGPSCCGSAERGAAAGCWDGTSSAPLALGTGK